MNHIRPALLTFVAFLSMAAVGQEEAPAYVPPEGEKLDYNKKFYPTANDADFVIELNPLMLIRRGLEIETEFKVKQNLTLGLDVVWFDTKILDENAVEASISYYGVEPKVRFYPLQRLDGVFMGAKLALGTYSYKIKGTKTWSKETFTVAPIVQVGYRITSFSGFTFAGYIGGGFNFQDPKANIDSVLTDPDKKARGKVNDNLTRFRPDFGLTFGMAI